MTIAHFPCFRKNYFLVMLIMHVFTCQVWFVGEKLGEGVGKTRKEAQHRAADMSLRNLAGMLLPFIVAGQQLLMNLNNI